MPPRAPCRSRPRSRSSDLPARLAGPPDRAGVDGARLPAARRRASSPSRRTPCSAAAAPASGACGSPASARTPPPSRSSPRPPASRSPRPPSASRLPPSSGGSSQVTSAPAREVVAQVVGHLGPHPGRHVDGLGDPGHRRHRGQVADQDQPGRVGGHRERALGLGDHHRVAHAVAGGPLGDQPDVVDDHVERQLAVGARSAPCSSGSGTAPARPARPTRRGRRSTRTPRDPARPAPAAPGGPRPACGAAPARRTAGPGCSPRNPRCRGHNVGRSG